jgi:hypothetical protein
LLNCGCPTEHAHGWNSAAGMNQVVVLPVIESALLKAVLAWYL